MAVIITWSLTNGGVAMTNPLDHGSDAAGSSLSEQEIFLRHTGDNQITDCGFYVAEYSGSYTGAFSPTVDLAELLEWGDAVPADDFGGFQINMDATGGYLLGWPTYSSKSTASYSTFRTDVGNTAANKILLATTMGLTGAAGTIQTGDSPNVRFKARIQIPTNEGSLGTRQFDQKFRYVYTS